MSAVSFDISMSLDGYIAAPHRRQEVPLGENGERLHERAFSDDALGREPRRPMRSAIDIGPTCNVTNHTGGAPS